MDKVRTVLVGCGGISRSWFTAAQSIPEIEFVGLVDIAPEAARTRANEFGLTGVPIGTDLGDMLQAARPDVVFNCTIPEAHMGVTLQALAFGCHVLEEKPLADSMDNARRMVDAAQRAGRIFAVIQNRRYDPNIRRLRSFLASGVLGQITTLNSDFYLGAHFGGFRDHMAHVLLLDMAIHTFDAARLISGADPLAVYCHEWNPAGSWYDRDSSAVAIFEMSGGLVYTYRGSWCAEGLNTTWECDWRAVGERGSATWDGATDFRAQVVAATGAGLRAELTDVAVPEIDPGNKVGAHRGVIAEFIAAVQSGTVPETAAIDNIKSLAMVFGAIESAETGRCVEIVI